MVLAGTEKLIYHGSNIPNFHSINDSYMPGLQGNNGVKPGKLGTVVYKLFLWSGGG